MNKEWKDGGTVDILREMMHLTLSIICKSVLNYDVESETEEVDRALTISQLLKEASNSVRSST